MTVLCFIIERDFVIAEVIGQYIKKTPFLKIIKAPVPVEIANFEKFFDDKKPDIVFVSPHLDPNLLKSLASFCPIIIFTSNVLKNQMANFCEIWPIKIGYLEKPTNYASFIAEIERLIPNVWDLNLGK